MLNVEAALDAQERNDSFRYWEGAVVVSGTEDDKQHCPEEGTLR